MAKHIVDDKPPELFPELYLKPRRLDYYARQLEENMNVNKELLKRINLIQRTGGYVDCWMRPEPNNKYKKLLCQQRQRDLDEIRKSNLYFYSRLLIARSEQLLTRELEELWKDTKHKLILGATIVPDLYCRGGDVTKDNGFGCYLPEGETEPMGAESFHLKHTVPGVLSMVVTPDNEVCGQFNIIFKPLPQFDGKHVVFGRMISGPAQTLERISALGLPLGTATSDCIIRSCGWFTRSGQYREGNPNTIKFPPRRKPKQ
ncbi:hypothetical protein O3G_MSEX011636 [Manduca sexta]|uniref:PPIase cyclophilin-type domain-containing protein n=1 Tax=Manduca sexta TaxID=7130 RepID=A0A922CVQ4_MANSE|nr:hypothetical protein O3G_MSEX011636 [Manduca sexta]KAG6459847.1 hypothetical protein O3G_MSEX011636 [Manduca sexta]